MFSRKMSVFDVLKAPPAKLQDQWLVEPIDAYLRALVSTHYVRDKFELLELDTKNTGFYSSGPFPIAAPCWLTKTKRIFKSPSDVTTEIYDMLRDSLDHPEHKNLFSIIEENGEIKKLRRDHEALVESRRRTLRYTSEVLRFKAYPVRDAYLAELALKASEEYRSYASSDLDFSTSLPFKLPGSIVFGFTDDNIQERLNTKYWNYIYATQREALNSGELDGTPYPPVSDAVVCFEHYGSEISKRDQSDYYDSHFFWKSVEHFFELIYKYEVALVDETNLAKIELLNAYKLLVSAAWDPKPIAEVEDALTIVINSIDNHSELRDSQDMLSIRWDLFGEALLETFCGNMEGPKALNLLKECADKSFINNPWHKQLSYEIFRTSYWNKYDSMHDKLIRDEDRVTSIKRMRVNKIMKLSSEGKIDIDNVVDSLLSLVISPVDRWDSLWVAVDIAIKAKDSHPQLAKIINDKLIKLTNIDKVTGKTSFPDSEEWFRRLCGSDHEVPRRTLKWQEKYSKFRKSIKKVLKNNAKKLAEISSIAKAIDLSATNTHEVLVNRTLSQADPAIGVALDELTSGQSSADNELHDFLREAKELSPAQLDEASILLEQLRQSLRSQPNGVQARTENPDIEKGQTLPGI